MVVKFDTAGNPQPFSALGSPALNGSDAGPDADQTPQNELGLGEEAAIAVDNSGGPSDGRIYVSNQNWAYVNVFAPSGAYISQFNGEGGPPATFSNPCGLAVDANGSLYVSDRYNNAVDVFDETGAYLTRSPPASKAPATSPSTPPATSSCATPVSAARVHSDSFPVTASTTYDGGRKSTPAHSTHSPSIPQTTPSSTAAPRSLWRSETFGAAFLGESRGIAVEASTHKVFASDSSSGQVHVFGPLVTAPDAVTAPATAVTETSATLSGTVRPNGYPADRVRIPL